MKSIILLSGPVGAGKSVVARELIGSSPGPIAYIEGDKFWSFIAKGAASQGRHKNFRMIMTAMTAAALPYALAGYEVVLDFSIPPWVPRHRSQSGQNQGCAARLRRSTPE